MEKNVAFYDNELNIEKTNETIILELNMDTEDEHSPEIVQDNDFNDDVGEVIYPDVNDASCPLNAPASSPNIPISVPDVFKEVLFWPKLLEENVKPKRQREKVPSVATSLQWLNYQESKNKKKAEILEAKENRKRLREEKKNSLEEIKKQKILTKEKAAKQKNITAKNKKNAKNSKKTIKKKDLQMKKSKKNQKSILNENIRTRSQAKKK